MASSRPYQGYPYVQPPVTDAPSISADTAARWQHLPRRQLDAVRGGDIPLQERSGSSVPGKRGNIIAPVVYIDLPEASGSDVADRRHSDGREKVPSQISTESKSDPDAPVVYIELPEASGSYVAQDREPTPHEEDPAFVQDTIFYDPFENRRIDSPKEETNDSDDGSEGSSSTRPQFVPRRPNTLDLCGASSSALQQSGAGSSTAYPSSSGMSSMMSKEASIYGQTDSNGLPASLIPVSQFPEPPPAYTEIDNVITVEQPVVEQPTQSNPPRTQVILPDTNPSLTTPIGIPNPDRKYMDCHHCGQRVHTLVVLENGTITHVTALACLLICILPCVAFIYCTDYLKHKNHYCPHCNNVIAHELPMSSKKIIYVG